MAASNKDQVVIDLTSYKDKVGARVPEGRYRVVVTDTEADKSNAGNAMINVWLDILDGEYKGETLVDRLTLVEKAMFRVVGFMKAIGLPTPRKRLNVNIKSWVGKVLEIDVSDGEPYNGSVKSEIRGYIRVPKASAPARTDVPDPQANGELVDDPWVAQEIAQAPEGPAADSAFAETDRTLEEQRAFEQGLAEFAEQNDLEIPGSGGMAKLAPNDVPDVVDLDSLDL